MFSRFLVVFLMYAAFGSGMCAVCNVNCDPPFGDDNFWSLVNKDPECDKYETCVNDALNLCSTTHGNDTAIFVSSFRAGSKVLDGFCRNPNPADLDGADPVACNTDKPKECLMELDRLTNQTLRCLAVGDTLDCLDDFQDACKARLMKKFVGSIKPTIEKIKKDCIQMGFSVGDDSGTNLQPTVLTLLVCVICVLFRNIMG